MTPEEAQTLIRRLSRRLGTARETIRQQRQSIQELQRQAEQAQGHLDASNAAYFALKNKRDEPKMEPRT